MSRSIVIAVVLAATGGVLGGAAGPATAAYAEFRSPTGKIGCVASDGPLNLRCDVQSPSYRRPARARWCPPDYGDYGDSFNMGARGRVAWTCHGDTTLGARTVLRYGRTWKWGPFRCTMRTTGVTCRNTGGHGFTLSTRRATRW